MSEDQHSTYSNRRYDYDIIRIFLTLLVVIGHAAFYNIITPFGGVHYLSMMNNAGIKDTISHICIQKISWGIYLFHMQAYFSLSGAIYRYQVNIGKKEKYKDYARKRFIRLFIPAITIWFIWNVPLKIVSGYYTGIPIYRIIIQFVFPSRVYLWFLQSLFLCSILLPLFIKIDKKKQIVCIMLIWLCGYLIKRVLADYVPLGNPLYYFPWLVLGYYIEDLLNIAKKNRKKVYIFVTISALLGVCFYIIPKFHFFDLEIIIPFFATITIFYFSAWIEKRVKENEKIKKHINGFSQYCFGIYLYAEPLNYIILFWVWSVGSIKAFGSEKISILIIIFRIIVTPLISVLIVKILRRTKIKHLY